MEEKNQNFDDWTNRLKQHEFTFNEEAWEKMDTLLDKEPPASPRPLFKDKRGPSLKSMLLLLLGASLLLFGGFYIQEFGLLYPQENTSGGYTGNKEIPSLADETIIRVPATDDEWPEHDSVEEWQDISLSARQSEELQPLAKEGGAIATQSMVISSYTDSVTMTRREGKGVINEPAQDSPKSPEPDALGISSKSESIPDKLGTSQLFRVQGNVNDSLMNAVELDTYPQAEANSQDNDEANSKVALHADQDIINYTDQEKKSSSDAEYERVVALLPSGNDLLLIPDVTRPIGSSYDFRKSRRIEKSIVIGMDWQIKKPAPLIGLSLRIPLHKKWSLEAGAQFKIRAEKLSLGTGLDIEVVDTQFLSNQMGVNVIRREKIDSTNTLRFIEVPLIVHYQLNSKLRLLAGAQVAFVSNSGWNIYRNYEFDSETGNYEFVSQPSTFGSQVSEGIRKWDIGLIVGANYRLTPRWSMELRYLQGISDLTDNEYYRKNDAYLNSGLQTAIKWYF